MTDTTPTPADLERASKEPEARAAFWFGLNGIDYTPEQHASLAALLRSVREEGARQERERCAALVDEARDDAHVAQAVLRDALDQRDEWKARAVKAEGEHGKDGRCPHCKGRGFVFSVRPYNPVFDIAQYPYANPEGIETMVPCRACDAAAASASKILAERDRHRLMVRLYGARAAAISKDPAP